MERQNFEDSWKKAFDDAEVSPTDKVWTNIELALEKEKGDNLKRRLVFFQLLAAASVVFALGIGSIALYLNNNMPSSVDKITSDNTQSTPSNIQKSPSQKSATNPHATVEANESIDADSKQSIASEDQHKTFDNNTSKKRLEHDNTLLEAINTSNHANKRNIEGDTKNTGVALENERKLDEPGNGAYLSIDSRKIAAFYQPKKIELKIPKTQEVDPVIAMLARLDQREAEVAKQKKEDKKTKNQDENLWTSLGIAAGSFDPGQAQANTSAFNSFTQAKSQSSQTTTRQTAKQPTGYSYSVGMNVGTKLSNRWVLQGGVNYLTNFSESENNTVVSSQDFQSFRPPSVSEFNALAQADAVPEQIVVTAPYTVVNNVRYLSVPMQAGYLLIDRSFGVQLNGGFATDLFIKSTTEAEGNVNRTTDDRAYRTVNFSGLLSTELSYRFGQRYRVAINPGIRYPFNTIYKDAALQSNPLTFDIGLRFRYIFK